MLDKLKTLGVPVDMALVEPVLRRVHGEMQRLRRVLTDDEVRAVAEAVQQER